MSDTSHITTYKPGQGVICRIESIEPGGYGAVVVSGKLPPPADSATDMPAMKAFVPSTEPLEIGQTVPATFVCMHNNRALMTFAFMLGTTETIQLSTAPDEENAFSIWVDSYPSNQRVRRAIDLFMPSVSGKLLHELQCSNCDAKQLLSDLELANFTGCIKARSEEKKSRSAMVIIKVASHRGRNLRQKKRARNFPRGQSDQNDGRRFARTGNNADSLRIAGRGRPQYGCAIFGLSDHPRCE